MRVEEIESRDGGRTLMVKKMAAGRELLLISGGGGKGREEEDVGREVIAGRRESRRSVPDATAGAVSCSVDYSRRRRWCRQLLPPVRRPGRLTSGQGS